jgi:hypothetical protein
VAAVLLRTPKAEAEQEVVARVYGRMVEVAVDLACGAMVEAAAPSSVAVEGLMALSSGAGAVKVKWFVEGPASGAARTCAFVPASMSGNGGVATAIAIATGIADRASAYTSQGAVVGVTDTIGVGA